MILNRYTIRICAARRRFILVLEKYAWRMFHKQTQNMQRLSRVLFPFKRVLLRSRWLVPLAWTE